MESKGAIPANKFIYYYYYYLEIFNVRGDEQDNINSEVSTHWEAFIVSDASSI